MLLPHLIDGLVGAPDPAISSRQVQGCPPVVALLIDLELVSSVKMLQHLPVTVHRRAVEWSVVLWSEK